MFCSVIRPLELLQGKVSDLLCQFGAPPSYSLSALFATSFIHLSTYFYRASSILQKNSKLYGPRNALDVTNGSSCWNSNACPEGQPQYLLLEFGRSVIPQIIQMEFQAGFIAETCTVQLQTNHNENTWIDLDEMEPEDHHDYQTFSLHNTTRQQQGTALKLVMNDFTDFYGRVTIYRIQVWGKEVPTSSQSIGESVVVVVMIMMHNVSTTVQGHLTRYHSCIYDSLMTLLTLLGKQQ